MDTDRVIDDFTDALSSAAAIGPSTLTDPAPVEELVARSLEAGWRLFHLDGSAIVDKATFLEAWAVAAGFPDWFGRNWDALADLLIDLATTDLSGRAVAGFVVVHDRPDVFASLEERDAIVAHEIMAEAAQSWADRNVPFVLLHRPAPAL